MANYQFGRWLDGWARDDRRARGGHRYLSQSCNAKQQPAANHTGCHADIHGYPVIRPGFPTVPGVQGVPIISFLDTLWNGWLIERLVCGNNGCFVSERERRSNRLNPACARLLFAPASATQRIGSNGDAKTTKPTCYCAYSSSSLMSISPYLQGRGKEKKLS